MTCARTYGTGKSLTRMGTIELLCSGSAGSYVQRPGCCQDIRLLYYFFLGGGGVTTTSPTTSFNTTLVDTTSIYSGGHAGHFHAIVT